VAGQGNGNVVGNYRTTQVAPEYMKTELKVAKGGARLVPDVGVGLVKGADPISGALPEGMEVGVEEQGGRGLAHKYLSLRNRQVRVAVCCSVLQCVAVCCSVLQCVAVCCSVVQYVAVCCSVLQCVAVCCSVSQRVAVCCSVLQCAAVCCSVLQCDAVSCSVLQCVVVCCSVLRVSQCLTVSCSVLQCVAVVCLAPT